MIDWSVFFLGFINGVAFCLLLVPLVIRIIFKYKIKKFINRLFGFSL